jgi:aminobenzoyl-glutamate utilization protein B
VDATAARWQDVSRQIWEFAETALKETKSSALLADVLEKEGFAVTRGAAGMPTAFVATAGSGTPVVAILAEYDALPGLSQKPGEAKKSALVAGAPGHGCGHNLLGTAAVAAAVAANRERIARKLPGTIRVYGTPAEEQILGKTFLLRDGVFAGTEEGGSRSRRSTSSSSGRRPTRPRIPGWAGAPWTPSRSSSTRCPSCASTSCRRRACIAS